MRVRPMRVCKPALMMIDRGREGVLESRPPDSLLQLNYAARVGGMILQQHLYD